MSTPPVVHAELDEGQPMSDVLAANDPDSGTVAVLLRPGLRRDSSLAEDVLHALGKDEFTHVRSGKTDRQRRDAAAWLRAHRTRCLIVGHAQWSGHGDRLLHAAAALAERAGTGLALVSAYNESTAAAEFVQRLGGHEQPLAQLLPAAPPAGGPDGPGRPGTAGPLGGGAAAGTGVDEVPHVEAVLFRAACRDLLPAPQADAADLLYRTAYTCAHGRLGPDSTGEGVHALLGALLADVDGPAEAVVVARAVQAAALARGWHLRLSLDALPALVASSATRRLTDRELRTARRLADPSAAAAVALYDAGLTVDDILAQTVGDYAADGQPHAAPPSGPLGPEALLLVRAQLAARALDGAGPSDPLVHDRTDRAVRDALHRAQRLGIPLPVARYRHGRAADRWQSSLGLSLQKVAA